MLAEITAEKVKQSDCWGLRPNSIKNARYLAKKIVSECLRKYLLPADDAITFLTEEQKNKMRVVIQDRKL